MTQSPGHQKWPEHKVQEKQLNQRVQVLVKGESVADSTGVIEVDEDKHQPRYYVPRSDVEMNKLSASNTTTRCPFKGEAHYFNVNVETKEVQDAAWSYEEPYDEHRRLKDYIAFHDEIPEVEVKRAEA